MTKSVFIAVPAGHGEVEYDFVTSMLGTIVSLGQIGYGTQLTSIKGCSEISIARSIMLRDFLASDCEYFMSIDADMSWSQDAVAKMISSGHEFIAACYPAKIEGEEKHFQHRNLRETGSGRLLQADGVPGGFILLRRSVAEKMVKAYPELMCERNGNQFPFLYMPMIIQKDGKNTALGEDYSFCQRWIDIGGKIFVEPDIDFSHYGKRCWTGNMLKDTRWSDGDNVGDSNGSVETPPGGKPPGGG